MAVSKSSLPPNQRQFITLMQAINFGSITFQVWGGEPDLSRPYHVSRTRKFAGGENGPRPEAGIADFELRREHIEMLTQIETLPDGMCIKVKLAHGLPGASFDIEEEHPAA